MRIVLVLTAISLTLCFIVLVFLLVRKEPTQEVLSFVVVLLVASIPIAIEIVRCVRACVRVRVCARVRVCVC